MVKIVFGYKQNVGKDTSCDYLIEKYTGVKLSFAQPLYNILNYAQEVCHFEKTKDRAFLQYIGTEWARNKQRDVWINLLNEKLSSYSSDTNIFVSDLRFKNEFENLKSHGFICVRIDTDTKDFSTHSSDIDLDNFSGWDYIITNYFSIQDLYTQLDLLILQCSNSIN